MSAVKWAADCAIATVLALILSILIGLGLGLMLGCGGAKGPCDQPSEPEQQSCRTIRLVIGPEWTADDGAVIQSGAEAWRRLCFAIADPDDPPCEGEYSITVSRDWTLITKGLAGLSVPDAGLIYLAGGILGSKLRATATHEVGHFLVGDHLPDGQRGVMQPTIGDGILTEADRAHACQTTGHCEWCEP